MTDADGVVAADPAVFRYLDSFTPAGPRRKRARKPNQHPPLSARARLDRVTGELLAGDWFAQCRRLILDSLIALKFPITKTPNPPINVLCLGLGSPTSSRNARAQLAFLLLVCDAFDISRRRVSLYDPEFTSEDLELLTDLEVLCLAENKQGMHPVQTHTITFLPHCSDLLNESYLRSNWTLEQLRSLVFIANDFGDFVDSRPTGKLLQANLYCLSRLAPRLVSRPLPLSAPFEPAFHGISIQHIGSHANDANDDDLRDLLSQEIPSGVIRSMCAA